ncbi:MAG: sigma 54-interacting transcriptional regulator [Sediminicola sp.]
MKDSAKEQSMTGNLEKITIESLHLQLSNCHKEREILLSLSDDITKVRQKSDLIKIFSSRLKGFFYFTHAVISLIDHKQNSYYPFLIDKEALHIKHRNELPSLLKTQYSINDPFIGQTNETDVPVSFLLDGLIDKPEVPAFLKINYECGIKMAMIAKLKSRMETFGYVFFYSDRTDSFPEAFKNVVHGIAPHLSNAVINVINNDEISQKERVNEILLSLSNDMVTVRDRSDLLNVINFGLKKLLYFTHNVMTELDESGLTYHAFLIDPESRIKKYPEYSEAITVPNPVADGIYDVASRSDTPIVFDMATFDLRKAPLWFRLNYEAGARELLIGRLPSGGDTIRSIVLFSDRPNTFDDRSIEILGRISSQLSTAASNISANEEIIKKEKDNSFLLEFSRNIAFSRTKEELSNAIHRSLKKLTVVKAYFIRTLNEDGETMSPYMHDNEVYYAGSQAHRALLDTKIPIDSGITGKVMSGSGPLLIDIAEEIDLGNTGPYIEFWKSLGDEGVAFQKLIGTPLALGDTKLGVLWIIAEEININILEGICAQISIAISDIRSNEEIANREAEKTILLSISQEIAALKKTDDLLRVVNKQLKVLFDINEFGFLQINQDGTYSQFMLELSAKTRKEAEDYFEGIWHRYTVNDPIFLRMMNSEDPVIFNVEELIGKPKMPSYVGFWNKLGYQQVLGTALRVGGKNIGCAFFFIDSTDLAGLKINLLKTICAQISVAIANIKSNEEIIDREEEKSKLLSLSHEIAALRSRSDLYEVVNSKIKVLLEIDEFGLAQVDEDGTTYSAFIVDVGTNLKTAKEFKEVTSAQYLVTDPVFSRIADSEDPVVFDVNALASVQGVPAYVHLWKNAGVSRVLCMTLRVGGKNIGCAFLHLGAKEAGKRKSSLLKSVCAQLSVAVSNIMANERLLAYKQILEVENDHLKEQIKTIYNFSDIIGSGPKMQKVYHLMSLVAESNSTILVLGETGTGKELIARAIHNSSPRKNKLMVKVNCAALPANLIESELFGHERGSFTGAVERRIGKFELANNSTLFLDEIGEMPLETQVKLLRVIQERELERVGGSVTIKVDVRIIAATNRDLELEVKEGRFRSDLFYRLNVFPIVLPPLRERLEDLEALVAFFITRYSKNTGRNVSSVSSKVLQQLKSYLWPGNVRELEHLIERSILLNEGNMLKEVQLPKYNEEVEPDILSLTNKTLHELERSYIIQILKRCSGKIAGSGGASEVLDLPATTLHSKIKKLRISKRDYFSDNS